MLKEGLEIKDYTLIKFLGKGSFGEVWLAEKRIEIADKRVPFALKFIPDNTHGISDYASVKREINTWIDASGNKNVISVQDGFLYDNRFVIVSEYADGGSLRQWLRTHEGKSPSIEKAVEIMCGVLDGLTHLHSRNIVHRDLKPENILLKGDVPCIADFGVSRIVANNSLEISAQTNTAGSPLYMSPESFERIKPAPQIDIWSAGVMLFEMLSGKTPYSADTIPGLIFEIVTKEPRLLPAHVPPSFHPVVKKALAKDMAERFQSAKEMREALMRALYSPEASLADSVKTSVPGREKAGAASIGMLQTLPLSRDISAVEINRARADGTRRFAWLGALAAFVIAAAIGVFMLTRNPTNITDAPNNTANSNQTATTNAVVPNSNNAAEQIAAEKPLSEEKPTEKSAEKTTVEKEKSAATRKNTTQTEAATKKDKPKPNGKRNQNVTLDDLIN